MSRRNYQLTELSPAMHDVLNSSVDWKASNLTYSAESRCVKSFGIRIAYARGRGWSWVPESDLVDDIGNLNNYENNAFRRHHSIIRTLCRAYNKHYCQLPLDTVQPQIEFPTPEPNTPLADALPEVIETIETTDKDIQTTPIPELNDAIIDFIMKLTDTIELFNQTIRSQHNGVTR